MATYGQFDTLGPFTAAIGGGWKLYHYVPGTTTTKNLWSDRDKQNTVAQPLVADSNGVVSFYADGLYDFVVYDSNDVLKHPIPGVLEHIVRVHEPQRGGGIGECQYPRPGG